MMRNSHISINLKEKQNKVSCEHAHLLPLKEATTHKKPHLMVDI